MLKIGMYGMSGNRSLREKGYSQTSALVLPPFAIDVGKPSTTRRREDGDSTRKMEVYRLFIHLYRLPRLSSSPTNDTLPLNSSSLPSNISIKMIYRCVR